VEYLAGITGDSQVGGVGGLLDPTDRSFTGVVFQQGKELLPKELNLITQIQNNLRADLIRSMIPSGFLDLDAIWDFTNTRLLTNASNRCSSGSSFYSTTIFNAFQIKNQIVYINGYKIYLGVESNSAIEIILNAPPSSGTRDDLVFVEAWFEEVAPVNDEGTSNIVYKYGGVNSGILNNDIQDTNIAHETTRRIQFRWRVRVIDGITDITSSTIKAWGSIATDSTRTFSLSTTDIGLYVATNLTDRSVDYKVYAVPMFKIKRRNTAEYNVDINPNGAVAYGITNNRPDGLFNNIIDKSDITDLRLKVSFKIDNNQGNLIPSKPAYAKDIALISGNENYITSYIITGEQYSVGYYGKVNGLITGTDLCSKTGLTNGTLFTSGDITWLEFYRKGKVLLIPNKPVRINLSWDNIQTRDLVKGKIITIKDREYLCRLMTGADINPSSSNSGSETGLPLSKGNNEWDDLFLYFYNIGVFNDYDIWTDYRKVGNGGSVGTATWCQEVHSDALTSRVIRGYGSASYFYNNTSSYAPSNYGWRPVLEVL
jgi:hypothetical protein